MIAEEGSESAITYARSEFISQPSLALAYRLAQLYASEAKDREAVEVLKMIRFITSFSPDDFCLSWSFELAPIEIKLKNKLIIVGN